MPRLTLPQLVERGSKLHDNKYTYLEVYAVSGKTMARMVCPIHGEFVAPTSSHFKGRGCKACGLARVSKARIIPFERVVEECNDIHAHRYTYISIDRAGKLPKLSIMCPEHGLFVQSAVVHKQGAGCPVCGNLKKGRSDTPNATIEKALNAHKGTYSYSKVEVVEGLKYLTSVCKEHGEFVQLAAMHINGNGCPRCARKNNGLISRLNFEAFVVQASVTHKNKFTYSDIVYEGKQAYVNYTCPEHGVRKTLAYVHLNSEYGCNSCAYTAAGDNYRDTLDSFRAKAFKVHGSKYVYESLTYDGRRPTIVYTCPSHGKQIQSSGSHLVGHGCPTCGYAIGGLERRHTFEQYIEKAQVKHGDKFVYKSLDYVEGELPTITYTCPKHGDHTQAAAQHLYGDGCPKCTNRVSKPSVEIYDFLTSLNLTSKQEHSFPGSRKIIDLVIPEHKLAIEYNGNYWHSSEYLPSNYHAEKTKLANANGYRMLHISSHEWDNKRSIIESIVRAACNKHTSKIFARKTELTNISTEEARQFLNDHHIQGAPIQGEYLALKTDKIVAVMCFNHNTSSRGQSQDSSHVELTRYVTSTSVLGGFTKLMNNYLKQNPQVKTVVSYSDNRMFTGTVYEKAGFQKMHSTGPNYSYLEGGTTKHKANYQKTKLAKRFGEEFCRGKTERQITEEQGIYRLYDCGLTKWLWTRP